MGTDGEHFILQNLMPKERFVSAARIHPLVMLPPSVLAVCSLLVGVVGYAVGKEGAAVGAIGLCTFAAATGYTLIQLVEHLTTEYSCTDRRIVIKSGLLTTRVREMPLAKVEALLIERTLFGRIFGYGTLVFKGSGGTRRTCANIENPMEFYRRVQEQVALAQRST